MTSGAIARRLYYKDFAGAKPASAPIHKEAKSPLAEEKLRPEPRFAAYVGIDWAERKHVWCLQEAGSGKCETGELEHRPEAVEAWVGELCRRFGYGPIAVAVEQV